MKGGPEGLVALGRNPGRRDLIEYVTEHRDDDHQKAETITTQLHLCILWVYEMSL